MAADVADAIVEAVNGQRAVAATARELVTVVPDTFRLVSDTRNVQIFEVLAPGNR